MSPLRLTRAQLDAPAGVGGRLRLTRAVLDAPASASSGRLRLTRAQLDAPAASAPPADGAVRLTRSQLDAPAASPSSEWVEFVRIGGVLVQTVELERRGGVLL